MSQETIIMGFGAVAAVGVMVLILKAFGVI
jgi:hypothetical protein